MWKVESEKYDEEFELMKKEFEVAYTQTWSYDSTPPSPPTSLESPSPLAIASDAPVSELSQTFFKTSNLQTQYLFHSPLATFPQNTWKLSWRYFHEDFHELLKLLAPKKYVSKCFDFTKIRHSITCQMGKKLCTRRIEVK